MAAFFSALVTLTLGFVGFRISRSIDKEVEIRIEERRLQAYGRLFAALKGSHAAADLAAEGARRLLEESLTDWYYCDGDGLVVVGETLNVFLTARHNLTCPAEQLQPTAVRDHVLACPVGGQDAERGEVAKRQMSLLRTQLKTDLKLYGRTTYSEGLSSLDRAFLDSCGVDLTKEPWSTATPATHA